MGAGTLEAQQAEHASAVEALGRRWQEALAAAKEETASVCEQRLTGRGRRGVGWQLMRGGALL
jgi:hypothetical protein